MGFTSNDVTVSNYLAHLLLNKIKAAEPISNLHSLSTAKWADNKQTLSVSGVASSSIILASADPMYKDSYKAAQSCNIRPTNQATNSITFTCDAVPDTTVYVRITVLKK